MAKDNGEVVAAGLSENRPPAGSVGEWVLGSKLKISPNGPLTPRHLSFIGPILGHMRLIKDATQGKAIKWSFNK